MPDPIDIMILQASWECLQGLNSSYLTCQDYKQHRRIAVEVEKADRQLQTIIDSFCSKYQMTEKEVESLLSTPV